MHALRGWVLGIGLLAASCGKSDGLLPPNDAGVPPAATCTGAPEMPTEANSVDSISENVDATCAAVAGYLPWKSGATGSACTDPVDCSPVCVPCPNGTHHTLASWCNHGACAAPGDVACMVAGTPSLKSCSSP
jgi:hypothetical protein